MESTPPAFGTSQLFLSDARLYLGILNHLAGDGRSCDQGSAMGEFFTIGVH